ncbi:hypothetical protein ACB092_03G024800 [Castanea dentata]
MYTLHNNGEIPGGPSVLYSPPQIGNHEMSAGPKKYRTTLSGAESVDEMPKRRASADGNPQLHVKTMQIQETLQLQLEVEKRLHEQLEVQQNLQIMIEEQWRQIKMMSHVQEDKTM